MSSGVETSLTISLGEDSQKYLEIELVRLPTLSPLPSRRNRPCRSPRSLHSSTEPVVSEVEGLGMTIESKTRRLLLDRFAFGCVLLSVNHYALERVDGAQHLRIRALDEILVLLRLDRIATATRGKKLAFQLHTHRDSDVGRDPVAMNDLLTRGVILRGRETQRRSVRQLHHILDRPFSEGCFTHHDCAVQIFECTADNLRAAGAPFVHQDCHRKIRPLFCDAGSCVVALLRSDATLGGNDLGVRRQKLRANIDRAVQ